MPLIRLPEMMTQGSVLVAVSALTLAWSGTAYGQIGSTFVDARSNIFGYGVSTPSPGGGGGGLLAITIDLTPGVGRIADFSASGGAWWNASGGSNGPDGGPFAANTNISAFGPISGYSAPRSGHLVAIFLETGDPTGMPPPSNASYPDAASLTLPSYSPAVRQVFFIGDGLTGTGSGATQTFAVPDTAARLVLGIADAFGFNGAPGYYNDNVGGYNVNYSIVPAPATILFVMGAVIAARRCR